MTILDLPKLSCRCQRTGQTWLISTHCSHKMFHFLSVSDGLTSILSDILMTLRKSHEIIWDVFLKNQKYLSEMFLRRLGDVTEKTSFLRYARDVLKKSHKRNFFKDVFRRLKDVTKKISFLRCIWDVLKTSQKRHLFWGISEKFLRYLSQWRFDWDLSEISHASCEECQNKIAWFSNSYFFEQKSVSQSLFLVT